MVGLARGSWRSVVESWRQSVSRVEKLTAFLSYSNVRPCFCQNPAFPTSVDAVWLSSPVSSPDLMFFLSDCKSEVGFGTCSSIHLPIPLH